MRFLPLITYLVPILVTALPERLENRQNSAVGYLAAVFKGDVPHVFFNIAPAASPSTFSQVKGGQAILVPTEGTKGARDPYIFRTQDKAKVQPISHRISSFQSDSVAIVLYSGNRFGYWQDRLGYCTNQWLAWHSRLGVK